MKVFEYTVSYLSTSGGKVSGIFINASSRTDAIRQAKQRFPTGSNFTATIKK